MKHSIRLFAILTALTFGLMSCGSKDSGHQHEMHESGAASADEWPQFDSFHMVMAEAYHPFKDSANLAPFKMHAAHLSMEAESWAGQPLPEKVNNDEMKAMIEKLKTDAAALAAQVSNGDSDESIGKGLEELHTHFHHIQEAWYKK